MIPKVERCVHAVRSGVRRAHILDGRIPHVLLLEFFTDEGIGTMVAMDATHDRTFDEHPALDAEPVHADLRPPPVTFVRGEGTELWDSEGKRVPRLPRAASR